MVKKVAVFTGTRADYGLLYWLLKDLQASSEFELQLVVSGSHLSPEFGLTIEHIRQDGFVVAAEVDMLLGSGSAVAVAKSLGLAVIGLADSLSRLAPDYLVVLGDRYEALAAAQTALLLHIPLLHIHGGEITQGAYDDELRHAITKLSYLHAVSSDTHRRRVIQLGEAPERVVTTGALGLDHLTRSPLLSRQQLSDSLQFELGDAFFLLTYHPVTSGDEDPLICMSALIEALSSFGSHKIVLTYPNADEGSQALIQLLQQVTQAQPERFCLVRSLGQQRYLSALKHCDAVLGNSSSGIIEAPAFAVATVNIGIRQQGREAAGSVLHCAPETEAIRQTIHQALRLKGQRHPNPYGEGGASGRILQMLRQPPHLPKRFYDLDTQP